MIVCSCNVLTDRDILDAVNAEGAELTPVEAYRCLGCAPRCGRCLVTIRRILDQAKGEGACKVGCAGCPASAGLTTETASL